MDYIANAYTYKGIEHPQILMSVWGLGTYPLQTTCMKNPTETQEQDKNAA